MTPEQHDRQRYVDHRLAPAVIAATKKTRRCKDGTVVTVSGVERVDYWVGDNGEFVMVRGPKSKAARLEVTDLSKAELSALVFQHVS